MKKEIKNMLIDALESGEYKHVTSVYKKGDCHFCAAGVLIDLYRKKVAKKNKKIFWDRFLNSLKPSCLSKVEYWAGVSSFGKIMHANDIADDYSKVIQYLKKMR